MKTRVGNEQTRCRVACGEQSFVLEGSSLAGSNVYYTFALFLFDQAKRKTHSFFTSPRVVARRVNPFVELI